MNTQSQRGFIAYAVMIAIGLVLVGAVFYYLKKEGFSGDKQEAMARLNTETNTLYNMKARYKAEREIINKIKNQYSGVRKNVLVKTDIFFDNANSENPQIKIKINNKSVRDEINRKRSQINKIFKEWEIKNEIINSDSLYEDLLPTINDLVKSAEEDMVYIKQYTKELQNIIKNISPANSNLTQNQIESYENIIENSAVYIEESVVVINQIQAEIPIPVTPTAVIVVGTSTSATSTTNSTESSAPAPVISPIVTLAEIQQQEQIVNEIKAIVSPSTSTTTTSTTLINYDAPTQIILTPSIIYYLPPMNIDYTGWPDIAPSNTVVKPSLLQGSN